MLIRLIELSFTIYLKIYFIKKFLRHLMVPESPVVPTHPSGFIFALKNHESSTYFLKEFYTVESRCLDLIGF